MPQEQMAYFIVMLIVLAIVIAIFGISNPFKSFYGNLSDTREMITIIDVAADPAKYDSGKYTITTTLQFHVDPDPDETFETVKNGIIPLISFKDSHAIGKLHDGSNAIKLESGEDDYNVPGVKFELVSGIKPMQDSIPFTKSNKANKEFVYDKMKFEKGWEYKFADDEENIYVISLTDLEMKGNILGFSKTCRARFRIECKDDLKQSISLESCEVDEEKCTDTTVLKNCNGGLVTIRSNKLYCILGYAKATVTTKGGAEWKDVGESATISLFRNSGCVNAGLQKALANGVRLLNENCPNDFLASRKITLKVG